MIYGAQIASAAAAKLKVDDSPVCPRNFCGAGALVGFERVRRHLSLGAGRRRVSGLTATARALYLPLMARAARQPVIVVVADNKAAEALEPMLQGGLRADRRGGPGAGGAAAGARCASL